MSNDAGYLPREELEDLLGQFWNWTAAFDPAGVTFGEFGLLFAVREQAILAQVPPNLQDWARTLLRRTWEMADDRGLMGPSDWNDRPILGPWPEDDA